MYPTGTISRITPWGALTGLPIPGGEGPGDLTAAPDGNFWFLERYGGITPSYAIGRITPAGALTDDFPLLAATNGEFYLPAPNGDLTAGPDGNLWISDYPFIGQSDRSAIVRITPAATKPRSRSRKAMAPQAR